MDHEGNLGSRPCGQLLCSMPGRYSVVECWRWVGTSTLTVSSSVLATVASSSSSSLSLSSWSSCPVSSSTMTSSLTSLCCDKSLCGVHSSNMSPVTHTQLRLHCIQVQLLDGATKTWLEQSPCDKQVVNCTKF